MLVLKSFETQMSDGKRMEIMNQAIGNIENNHNDLRRFNSQNAQLSLSRAKSEQEIETVRKLYGL
jgi:hypothetical protein